MGGGPSIQYSADGRWWWDGSQWRPVPTLTAPQPQPPGSVVGQGYPTPTSGSGFPTAVIVVLAVFTVLLLVGGIGLFLALRSAAERLSPTANPPMPAVSLPVGSSGSSFALPPIHGISASQVTAALTAKGYTCTGPRHVAETWITSCSLTDDANGVLYDVSIGGSDPASVGLVSAGIISTHGPPPTSAQASQFFSAVVATVAQGSEASQANTWVQQHLATGGEGTVGSLQLDLGRPASNYLLVITST